MFGVFSYLIKSNFGENKHYYKAIHDIFGIYPNNIELYKLALIHKSASIVLDSGVSVNNERLEYLGDAVIESVVSDMLYVDYPLEGEGFMTQLRSKIVNRKSLNLLAEKIGLDREVIFNGSMTLSRKHLNGDAFEAMMGAIYLDKGYDYVNRLLINRIFARHLDIDQLVETENDHKSRLIEWCQKNRKQLSIRCKQGSDYTDREPQFVATVCINGKECGYGIGESKKEAEQRAAGNTMKELNI